MRYSSDSNSDPHITEQDAALAVARAAQAAQFDKPGLVTRQIASLTPYFPGKPWREVAAELGMDPTELIQLAANENVIGPSQKALEAAGVALQEAHLYPDGGVTTLRTALAERHDVSVSNIAVGNGSNEIIELLVRTFVGPGETVVTAWPSFVVYRLVTQAAGRETLIAPLRRDRYDLATLAGLVDERTKLVFIANPNNPTGTYVTRREVEVFLERIPRSVIVVLDEAYFEYVDADDYPNGIRDFKDHPNVVVLRTFSKIYGLAGLRVGYGVMSSELVHYLNCVRQPYNVNAAAQAAALAALSDQVHVELSQSLAWEGKKELGIGLGKLGFQVVPTQANFMLVRLKTEAHPIVQALRKEGVLVRDMRGYDMPDTIRLTIGNRAMNLKVLDIMERLHEGILG